MTQRSSVLVSTDGEHWLLGSVCEDMSVQVQDIDLPDNATVGHIADAVAACITQPDALGESQEPDSTSDVDELSTADNPESLDDSVQPKVAAIPKTSRGVILGIPSSWCLCGTVDVSDLPPRQRRNAMLFALEDKLPVTAESVVADFVVAGKTALGIAAEVQRLRELIDACEQCGIYIDAICPTALLALQHLFKKESIQDTPIVWRDAEGLNLFEFDSGGWLAHWRWLKSICASSGQEHELSDSETQWLNQQFVDPNTPKVIRDNLIETATLTAKEIQAGHVEPLINFRRDALDVTDRLRRLRGYLLSALTAAAILLLTITGTCWWRAQQYQQAELQYQSALTSLYHENFGDQPLPTSVKRRFGTRLRELKGLRGDQIDDNHELETTSALWLLHDILERLPSDMRICILDITIEQDHITLIGQARTHGDADRIASALRKGNRFDVEPPDTRKLSGGGVTFTLNLVPIDKAVPDLRKSTTLAEMADTTTKNQAGQPGEVLP